MQIACKEVTGKDCDYTVEAEDATDAVRQMRSHVQTGHPEMSEDEIADMEIKINDEFEDEDDEEEK